MEKSYWNKGIGRITAGFCSGCAICNGISCAGKVPGMGGVHTGATFINNVISWDSIEVEIDKEKFPEIGVAPMTGVEQNMGGFIPEEEFHKHIVQGAVNGGIFSCIGDGTPDWKLLYGAKALAGCGRKGHVFIKPYKNNKILERYEWIKDNACSVGIDIDAANITTMRGMAVLEKKTSSLLLEIKKNISHPFILKGIYRIQDIELVKEVKPDGIVISNHGGRIEDNLPGIAWFLKEHVRELRNYTGEIWVDGGIRNKNHLLKAAALGADKVLIGRPFIQGTALYKEEGIPKVLESLYS